MARNRAAKSLPHLRTLFIGAAAVVLGGVALMAWSITDERRVIWNHAVENAQNIGSALANDIDRSIKTYDLSLQAAIDGLKVPGIWNIDAKIRQQILFDGAAGAPDLGGIVVLNEKGDVVVDSATSTPRGGNFADRDYFQAHRDHADSGLYISAPSRSRISNVWSIFLSRRIDKPDGSFGGIVVGIMRLAYFTRLFDAIDLGANSSITLFRADGIMVMRKPLIEPLLGHDSAGKSGLFIHYPVARSGDFQLVAGIDGIERLYAYRQVGDLPLVINLGQTPDSILAPWRQKAIVSVIALVGLMGIAGWLAFALARELKRRGEAEQSARDSERHFRLLAENSSDMLVRSRPGEVGRLYVSPACRQIYGYEPEELIGADPEALIHPDDVAAFQKSAETLDYCDRALVTYRIRRKDGSYLWVESSRTRAINSDTGEAENISIVRDVSERQRHEEELRAAKESADAASHAKSDFLAKMSHEIRTPMNGIIGMNELLGNTPLSDRQREYVQMIGESATSLLAIINDILDISKLEAGKVELEAVDFDLDEVVENAVMLLASKAREQAIDLGIFIEPAARGAYRGDSARLRQIILNLVSNALKFTEKGGVTVKVAVAPDAASGQGPRRLRFTVTDTGIGMSDEVRTKLFQKFEQADSSMTRRFGGTGLGLAICRQLVELMGGTIGVGSKLDVGTTFWFELPLAMVFRRETTDLTTAVEKGRALIVAGAEVVTEILARDLRAMGLEATVTNDGLTALAELEHGWRGGMPYALVMLDEAVSNATIAALAGRIKTISSAAQTKLVLVSWAHANGARALPGTVDAILEKPLRPSALRDCLRKLYMARIETPAHMPAATVANAPTVAALPTRRGLNILLAEDNKINQRLALAILEHAGHAIDVVDDGHKAVEAVRAKDYDVVLMDSQMPGLDGVEATRQIRALPPPKGTLPIIALTANAMMGASEHYLAAGMTDYVSKPIDARLLIGKLDALLQSLRGEATADAVVKRRAAGA